MNNLEKKIQAIEKELEQLKQELKKAQDTVGFGDDEIFLLSIDEYEKYKNNIPLFIGAWWLRSPSFSQDLATSVTYDGSVIYLGSDVIYDYGCVRPALKITNQESEKLKIGEVFVKYLYPWVYLGDGIAIAETPIATRSFDEESNCYVESEVRKFLLDWLDSRRD